MVHTRTVCTASFIRFEGSMDIVRGDMPECEREVSGRKGSGSEVSGSEVSGSEVSGRKKGLRMKSEW